jgi:N-acetylglucosaminyldiphosphoundecaprenol N-acetyl-beta-D-mannosaminyltransferase
MSSERLTLLGLPVDSLDVRGLLDAVGGLIAEGRQRPGRTVAYLNVHVANTAYKTPDLTAFLKGVDLCYCDGAGIVLGARLMGHRLPGRMTGADWIWDLAQEAADQGWRIFWLGGKPGVTDRAAVELRGRHPSLEVESDHGYHTEETTPGLLARINAFAPDILLVGMGTPVQERWVARYLEGLEVPVVWCLGATADFVAGEVDRGPAWLHNNQEWLARLITEPRRLWKRYLVGNPIFLARVTRDRLRRL